METKEISAAQIAAIPKDEQTVPVTIGVACYNIAPYIARCLDSILAQTYRNLEILVVDNGSADASAAICDDYAKNDPRIRVIRQDNNGPGGARNRAINEAKGEYLAFVDGDDMADPRMIEAMMSCVRTFDADMAVCRYRPVPVGRAKLPAPASLPLTSDLTLMDAEAVLCAWAEEDERHVIQNASWNKLYKKSLVGTLRFPENRIYEEILYTPALLMRAKCVCYIDHPLYYYVSDRPHSVMNDGVSKKILTDFVPPYRKCAARLRKWGYDAQADALEYLFYKKLLLYYTEARRSRDKEKRACMPQLEKVLRTARKDMDRIYGCRIANPREKMRMQLFLTHPALYNRFMDLNEGIILPARRRLAGR